jgi:phytoene desaturase
MTCELAPRRAAYDVVVIGSGLGGLTAAALSAARGKSVLLVEQADHTGGYAHGFSRGPYKFDAGIHTTSFGWIEPTLPTMLREMGVGDRVEFARCEDPLYSVFMPGMRFDAPSGVEAFLAAHAAEFPEDARELKRLYGEMQPLTEELTRPRPEGSLHSLQAAEGEFDRLLRFRSSTLDEIFEQHALSKKMRALLSASWINLGLPPSRLSFVSWAPMVVVRVETGEYYCIGTFQSLVDALTEAIRLNGGDVAVRTPARRIVVEEGRVVGVELEDSRTIAAEAVVANADAHQTLLELVGEEQLPDNIVRRVSRMQASSSAVVLYAATALPREAVDLPHQSYVHDTWDHEESWERIQRGEPSSFMLCVPSLTDPSVAPTGEQIVHCVALVAPGTRDEWAAKKQGFVEKLLQRIDAVMPGFRDKLVFVEAATPPDLVRRARNHEGAVYGWANSPAQVGSKRPSNKTPIDGLYLASQWTQPGTGSLGSIYAGVRAANLIAGGSAEHLALAE